MCLVKLEMKVSIGVQAGHHITYDDAVPVDLVDRRLLFDHHSLSLETALLLAEATFNNGVCGQNLCHESVGGYVEGVRDPYDVELFEFLGVRFS